MGFASRVDGNQGQIVAALRRHGIGVKSLASVGDGFPDLVVGYQNLNVLLELKDGRLPESKRGLRPGQRIFHNTWPGQVAVVTSAEEALEVIFNHCAVLGRE